MSEEARQQMQARLDAISQQVSASMAFADDAARARQRSERAIGVTLVAGGAVLLAIALYLLR
jgi:type VI protein secretion system component VasF